MIELRITDVAYPGLPHVFVPAGLRLVAKSEGASPTTSVLVRGAAGTGKTTLSLAIAHAIAKASHGIALYVATEASLADVIDKASVIKLGDTPVVPYDAAAALPEGAVALAHLVIARDAAQNASPSDLAKLVVEYAYELASAPQAGAPVRAVVVDSFELQEGEGQKLGRSELAAFVQSLESLGVSPVFIEEFSAGMSERLTFVVDIVLQLALSSEPPSITLHRRLAVLKSRYSQAVAGPHEMGIDEGVPTVWPDSPSLDFGVARSPVGFVMPMTATTDESRGVLALNRGALILSRYDVDHQSITSALSAAPHLVRVDVQCGPYIRLLGAGRASVREVPATFGPSALKWAIHRQLASSNANAVIFHRLETLLAQPRFTAAIPELLASLTRRNFLVCVHGTSDGLAAIDALADFAGPTGHRIGRDVKAPIARKYRALTAWVRHLPGLTAPPAKKTEEHDRLAGGVKTATDRMNGDDLAGAHEVLNEQFIEADPAYPWGFIDDPEHLLGEPPPAEESPVEIEPAIGWGRVELALLMDRLGQSSTARALLEGVRDQCSANARVRAAVAWAFAEIGAEWEASSMAFELIAERNPPDSIRCLCRTTFLRYSGVQLRVELKDWADPIQWRFAAQALAGRNSLDSADKMLTRSAARQGLPAGHLARLQADVRLESSDLAAWRDADARYAALEAAGGLSRLERADVLFNRGVIAERLGDTPLAIERFRAAKDVNPFLEMADERLAALDVHEAKT